MKKTIILSGIAIVLALTGCKSAYEKQGDDHLNAGRYKKALQRYKYVTKKGNGSNNFTNSLTHAYIGAFGKDVEAGQDIEALYFFKDKIGKLLPKVTSSKVKAFYVETAVKAGKTLAETEDAAYVDLGFKLFKEAVKTEGFNANHKSVIDKIEADMTAKAIQEATDQLESAKGGEAQDGILADYILSKLALFVEPTDEVKTLWSEIRKVNLSTYLMYDLENLIEGGPLPRINKYGVLLAITDYKKSGNSLSVQLKAFNGTSVLFKMLPEGFKLVDKQGNEYSPVSHKGAFSKKKELLKMEESGVVAMTFKLQSDMEPDYIEYTSNAGVSRKYLP